MAGIKSVLWKLCVAVKNFSEDAGGALAMVLVVAIVPLAALMCWAVVGASAEAVFVIALVSLAVVGPLVAMNSLFPNIFLAVVKSPVMVYTYIFTPTS